MNVHKMGSNKRIALIAHDNKKAELIEWAIYNKAALSRHRLCATGTTGKLLEKALNQTITKYMSGPLGGDQQIGARIAERKIDVLIFFWDPLEPQPHDPDVKALLRMAVVWNIPIACDRSSADFMISSPLMTGSYERTVPDYTAHNDREIPIAEDPAWEERAGEDPAGEDEESDRAPFDPALAQLVFGAHVEDERRIRLVELLEQRRGGDPLDPRDQVLVDHVVGANQHLVGKRIANVLQRHPPEHAIAQTLDYLAAFDQRRHLDPVERAAVAFGDNRILRHVH